VVPLGGIGEIGKSMMAVEYGDDMVLIDAGGKFPEEWERGIDLIIPDIRYVKNRLSKLRGIAITHGHEDHIGALPYIIPQLEGIGKIPVFGSPLAMGFAENKLREARLDEKVELHPMEPRERVQPVRLHDVPPVAGSPPGQGGAEGHHPGLLPGRQDRRPRPQRLGQIVFAAHTGGSR
jgi:ribonuclease J